MVCDLGGANRGLHNELNISEAKPYFENHTNKEKIFVFADVPHLIKLIRNNFVDHGFVNDNNKEIKKEIVEQAISATSVSDLKITHKITSEQLNVAGPQRQKVKYAAKLFSHTMSSAISRCGSLGFLTAENWVECAEFFKLVCYAIRILSIFFFKFVFRLMIGLTYSMLVYQLVTHEPEIGPMD